MARVTVNAVRQLLGDPSADCQTFIDDASLWIDNYLVGRCRSLAADKLPVIEKYLAAHMYARATTGGELVRAQRGDIMEQYAQASASETTRFIQTAAAFDPCGIVAAAFQGKSRTFGYVGRGYDRRHGAGGTLP